MVLFPCWQLPWNIGNVLASVACATVLYVLWRLLYNVLLHPLHEYPGPRLWAASRIPYAFACMTGQGHRKILQLHEAYGDIVRVAPNELSYCSPEAWKEVFGRRKTAAGEIGKDSLHYAEAKDSILGAPKEKHTQLRRILGRGFSHKAVLDQERLIKSHVDQLFNILSEHEETKGWEVPIDVNKLFDFVALDIITDLGFGASFHCLSAGEYHPWAKFFLDALPGIAFATAMKQFEIVFKLLMALAPKSLVRKHEEMVLLTNSMVEKRLEEADRPDLIQAMCQPFSENERRPLSIQEIKANAQILTMAGYDTTATALAGATFLLITNASAMVSLCKEIRSAFQHESEINISTTSNLAYLRAAIDEALRMYPPGGSGMPRQVPKGGAFILNQHIPAGTIVSIWQYAMYHSARNFTQPESFVPERWLNDGAGASFSHDRKETFQPFSFGPRDCIGRNLAYAELRIVLARLVWNFDLELAHESDRSWLGRQKNYLLWERGPLLIRLRRRTEDVFLT
ncbi:cytochrome P450 CYP11/CYP12/CYP24/CYP27 subfamily protein [Colletotrichum sublineola]|nr:cytochrome P450 CYP11/CYP12/CYP24/CYP27 subfamily protein [Colletotrichum sublineola]